MRRLRPALGLVLVLGSTSGCTAARAHDATSVPRIAELDDAPPSTLTELDVVRFVGRWYVVRSNFAMWKQRKRSDPSFLYEAIHNFEDPAGLVKLADRVDFRQGGRPRKYVGVDLQDPTRAGHFQWRGDGVLYGVKNQWYVVHVEPDYRWAIIYFSRSNFGTGAGIEVIARTTPLAPADERRAAEIVAADPFLRARSAGMFTPAHAGPGG